MVTVATGKKLTRCKECRVPVGMHFNHVGRCEPGCTGTFEHPSSTCRYGYRDLTHDLVELASS